MKAEEQNIAILGAMGWKRKKSDNPDFKHIWVRGEEYMFATPDFTNDLNAMHEAEKILDITNGGPSSGDCLRYAYTRELYILVSEWIQPCRATAAQRAEAFLKTLKLWKE